MGKVTITHSCGCTKVHNLFGKLAERDRLAERLRNQPCADCARRAEIQRAKDAADHEGLPPLVGTSKQVTWALALRQARLDELVALEDPLVVRVLQPLGQDRLLQLMGLPTDRPPEAMDLETVAGMLRKGWRTHLLAHTDATWWIAHRASTLMDSTLLP